MRWSVKVTIYSTRVKVRVTPTVNVTVVNCIEARVKVRVRV